MLIEEESSNWPKDQKNIRMYHDITRDLVSNEIFRRVNPDELTMGEFLRDVIRPEHQFDIIIGMNKDEEK